MSVCSVEGCSRVIKTSGLCGMHYQRLRTTGDVGGSEPILVKGIRNCDDRSAEYSRRWRENNRDKSRISQRLRRESDPEKFKVRGAEWRANNPDSVRNSYLKYTYGITLDEYARLLEFQNGRCAICEGSSPGGRKETFGVDHDHNCCPGRRSCGRCIRGLLCVNCNNRILGGANDNPDVLRRAVEYLERK